MNIQQFSSKQTFKSVKLFINISFKEEGVSMSHSTVSTDYLLSDIAFIQSNRCFITGKTLQPQIGLLG